MSRVVGQLLIPIFVVVMLATVHAMATSIRVSAAVSMKESLTEIARTYEAQTHDQILFTFGSSGQLASQIKSGAPVDLFISASATEVDDLARGGLVDQGSRRDLASNELVLIVPTDSPDGLSFEKLTVPSIKRIAIGEPRTVPAGQYALQVLTSLKLADDLAPRLVYGANVRQVLDYVERGEVAAGIVYSTDALQSGPKVKVVAAANPNLHEPIVYPAVIIKGSANNAKAAKFVDYIVSEKGLAVLKACGFTRPPGMTSATAPGQSAVQRKRDLWQPLLLSLRIAGTATLISAMVGIPLALFMSRRRFAGKSIVDGLIVVPMVMPPTVVGYAIITLFGSNGWAGQWLYRTIGYSMMFRFEGAVLAAAVVALPMLYLPAKAGFAAIQRDLEDNARLMGAGRWQLFWYVSLPMARRGIYSGLLLAFARAIGEFGATVMVFGWQATRLTLPISVFADYEQGELPHAAAAVLTLGIVSLVLTMAYNRSAVSTQQQE